MQTLSYDIKSGDSITLWRGIEAQIEFYNFDSLEGDWKFLVDCDWIDGVILSGATQIVSNKLIVTLDEMDSKELAFAIQGKEKLKCKATLTDLSENVIIIQMNVKNRAIQSEPKPIQAYYTKLESDSRFAPLTGLMSLNEIVSADVSNLANNYWTKQEVSEQIANIEKLGIEVVQELPPASEGKDFTVYLVPLSSSVNNVYQEYLRINQQWELIGTTAVDLSNYVQKTMDFNQSLLSSSIPLQITNLNKNILKYNTGSAVGTITLGELNSNEDFYTIVNGRYTKIQGSNVQLNSPSIIIGMTSNSTTQIKGILSGANDVVVDNVSLSGIPNNYLSLSGGTLSGKLNLSDIGLRFNDGQYYWHINKFGNIFSGTATQTVIHNQNVTIEGRTTTDCKINLDPISGHLQYRGHNENTAGGFVIQDDNGIISGANDVTTLSGYSLNNSLQLSGGTVGNYAHFNNNEVRFGTNTAASTGNFHAYGMETNIRGLSVRIGWINTSHIYHGNSIENTPNGFVIQDGHGGISLSSIVLSGDATISGYITSKGKQIIPLTGTTFIPQYDKVYQYTLSGNETFDIDVTNYTSGDYFNFDLQLIQGSTPVSLALTGIIWSDSSDNYVSTNPQPDFSTGNKLYDIELTFDGTDLLGKLKYTKSLTPPQPSASDDLTVTSEWIMPITQDEQSGNDIGPALSGQYTLQDSTATGKQRVWKQTVQWDNNGTLTSNDLYIWYMPYNEDEGFGNVWIITLDAPQYYGMFETACQKESDADSPIGLTNWSTSNISGSGNLTIA